MNFTATEAVLNNFMPQIVQALSEAAPSASGEGKNSFQYDGAVKGDGFVEGSVTGLRYMKAVDSGRAPTQGTGDGAVKRNIRRWIDQKGITPGTVRLKSGRERNLSKDELAFLISRKIHKEGFPAKPFIQKAVEPFTDPFRQALAAAIREDIDNSLTTKP